MTCPLPDSGDRCLPTQGEHGFSPPGTVGPGPLANHQGWGLRAARRVEPVDPIRGIGIKNAITN